MNFSRFIFIVSLEPYDLFLKVNSEFFWESRFFLSFDCWGEVIVDRLKSRSLIVSIRRFWFYGALL